MQVKVDTSTSTIKVEWLIEVFYINVLDALQKNDRDLAIILI
jgi:hypothetical protein